MDRAAPGEPHLCAGRRPGRGRGPGPRAARAPRGRHPCREVGEVAASGEGCMQEALYPGLRPRDSTGRAGLGRGPPPQVNSGHWLWAGRRPEPGRDERVCQGGGGWGAGFLRAPPVLAQASCCWAPAPGISDARSCSQRPRVSSPGQPCAPWRGAWGAAPQGRPFLPTPHPRSPAHCRRLPVVLQLLARPTDSGQGQLDSWWPVAVKTGVSVPGCVAMPPGQAPSPRSQPWWLRQKWHQSVDPQPQAPACGHRLPRRRGGSSGSGGGWAGVWDPRGSELL